MKKYIAEMFGTMAQIQNSGFNALSELLGASCKKV